MGRYEKITAEVTDEMAAAVRSAVSSGAYATADEVVRDALTGWLLSGRAPPISTDKLKGLLQTSLDSGPGTPAEQVFARLKAKYTA